MCLAQARISNILRWRAEGPKYYVEYNDEHKIFNQFLECNGRQKNALQLHRVLRIWICSSLYALRLRLLHPRNTKTFLSIIRQAVFMCAVNIFILVHFFYASTLFMETFYTSNQIDIFYDFLLIPKGIPLHTNPSYSCYYPQQTKR